MASWINCSRFCNCYRRLIYQLLIIYRRTSPLHSTWIERNFYRIPAHVLSISRGYFLAPIQYKMTSYQYRKSHCGYMTILRPSYLNNGISYTDKISYQYGKSQSVDKTILRPCYLHYGISYTGKIAYLYWIRAQASINRFMAGVSVALLLPWLLNMVLL